MYNCSTKFTTETKTRIYVNACWERALLLTQIYQSLLRLLDDVLVPLPELEEPLLLLLRLLLLVLLPEVVLPDEPLVELGDGEARRLALLRLSPSRRSSCTLHNAAP